MSKLKVNLNRAGVAALLKDQGIAGVCQEEAGKIASRAGAGYEVQQRNYPERTGYAISAETPRAIHDNFENNTLLKAINGG